MKTLIIIRRVTFYVTLKSTLTFVGLFLCSPSFAKSSVLKNGQSKTKVDIQQNQKIIVDEAGLSYNQDSLEKGQYYGFNYDYKDSALKPTSELQFMAGYYPETAQFFLGLPQAYKSWSTNKFISQEFSFGFGRKKLTENFLDSQWNLGTINPYFSLDQIDYTTQGLTGIHTRFSYDNFSFGLSYSALHIPNQGPVSQVKDGKVTGANTWTQKLPETFMFNNKENNIKYNLKNVDSNKIIMNNGFHADLILGSNEHNGILISGLYSDGPMNDLVISRTVNADLNLNGLVDIYPVIRFSKKWAGDIKYTYSNWKYKISYIKETPENKLEDGEKAVQSFSETEGLGAGIDFDASSFFDLTVVLNMGYARFSGGETQDLNADGKPNNFNLSDSQLQYTEPFTAGITLNDLSLFERPLAFKTNWIYDFQQEGSVVSIRADHRPLRNLKLNIGFDILGSNNDNPENKKRYISKNKLNDRVTGGLEYVF